MGHKVHPVGFRLGFIKGWQAKWYADAHYPEFVLEDLKLRKAIDSQYREAAISLVEIDRQAKEVTITLHTARPGIVIGRGGQRVDEMRAFLEKTVGKRVRLNISEIRQPELDAHLVARAIADQIERRIAYRRAMKQAIFRTMQTGAKGVRVSCAGRLGDAEIARRQIMHEGQVPLHTLRADIDYGFVEAHTTMGRIGVKVWIYKGEVFPEKKKEVEEAKLAEVAAEKVAEVVPVAAAEPAEKVQPVAEAVAAAIPVAEARAVEPLPEVAVVAVPAETKEEKPAKPVRRRRKAVSTTEAKEKAEAKEKTAEAEEKPKRTRRAVAKKPTASETEGKEAKDAAA